LYRVRKRSNKCFGIALLVLVKPDSESESEPGLEHLIGTILLMVDFILSLLLSSHPSTHSRLKMHTQIKTPRCYCSSFKIRCITSMAFTLLNSSDVSYYIIINQTPIRSACSRLKSLNDISFSRQDFIDIVSGVFAS
jgi:hypothetical protein